MQKQKITAAHLAGLFTKADEGTNKERIIYHNEYLSAPGNTPERDLYEIVSDVAFDSGLTHGFSYEIMSRAVDVLAEAYNHNEPADIEVDYLHEDIDAIVPVYNYTLLMIANPGDYHNIDEAREVFGNDIDTIEACRVAWFSLIESATRDIHERIVSYNEAE